MALQPSVLIRSSLRALVSSTPTVSRSYLPYSSLTSVTRYASSISDNLASTSTAPPSSSTTPPLPNQPQVIEPTLLTHQQSPPRPPVKPTRAAPRIKASKSALTLTPDAVQRLRNLLSGPTPQLIRIGVRNKGCAGMQYHLEYVEEPGKFDEIVEQDGVRVLIDSKALFSIIGSEMHWQEDQLSSKFVFKNPNIIDACGCGESFNVAAT